MGDNDSNDEIELYKVFLERHTNDDRLMNERMSAFLLANSILFAGFVILISIIDISYLRILVALIGIILSVFGLILAQRTLKGLEFWAKAETKIEKAGNIFKYMRGLRFDKKDKEFYLRSYISAGNEEMDMNPHSVREYVGSKWLTANRIYTFMPLLFLALWIASLVWAACHWGYPPQEPKLP